MELSSQSPETDHSMTSIEKPEIQASKKRKVSEKMVVTVKIEENEGKQRRSELGPPPSDCWSWRKYGQKPIKGSPYPRGYYKCSTSKGCMAKKQVERCRTDASMLIITYTSSHNHPSPNNLTKEPKPHKTQLTAGDPINPSTPEQEEEQEQENEEEEQPLQVTNKNAEGTSTDNDFHYCQSPFKSSQDIIIGQEEIVSNPFTENHLLLDVEPISYPHLMTLSTVLKSEEENDFYDELEELPMSSPSFTRFMRSNFFEERILVQPS